MVRSQLDLIYEKMTRATQQQQNQQGRGFKENAGSKRTSGPEPSEAEDDPTNTSVFFFNLPHSITDQTLYNLCAYYGHVRSVFIKYPKSSPEYTTQSVLAFVTMNTHEDAQTVIQNLYGYSLEVGTHSDIHCRSIQFVRAGDAIPPKSLYWYAYGRVINRMYPPQHACTVSNTRQLRYVTLSRLWRFMYIIAGVCLRRP